MATLFPPFPEGLSSNKATLVSLISDSYPGSMMVESKCNPITQGVETTEPLKLSYKYWASSYLSLTSDRWNSGLSYSCQVTHDRSSTEKAVVPAACS